MICCEFGLLIYLFHAACQHGVLKKNKPHGLPLNVTTLPEMLKNLGYATHAIGKLVFDWLQVKVKHD